MVLPENNSHLGGWKLREFGEEVEIRLERETVAEPQSLLIPGSSVLFSLFFY